MEASHTLVISLEEAKSLVIKHVNPDPNMIAIGDEWIIVDDTIETKFGWIFRVDSRIHVETGSRHYQVRGQYGIVIEKTTGKLWHVGPGGSRRTALTILEFRRTHSLLAGCYVLFYSISDMITGNYDL